MSVSFSTVSAMGTTCFGFPDNKNVICPESDSPTVLHCKHHAITSHTAALQPWKLSDIQLSLWLGLPHPALALEMLGVRRILDAVPK